MRTRSEGGSSPVRVATYNIRHGAAGLQDVVETSQQLDVSVLAVHEVDRRVRRSGNVDQAAALQKHTGGTDVSLAWGEAVRVGRPGRRGSYGNALLARAPMTDVAVLRLPRLERREPRSAVLATVHTPELGPLTVAATHLGTRRDESTIQLAAVIDALLDRPGPHLLLGDLNRRAHEVDQLVAAGFEVAGGPPTYPSHAPELRIDHVAVRGIGIVGVEVPDSVASDHRPLVVEVS